MPGEFPKCPARDPWIAGQNVRCSSNTFRVLCPPPPLLTPPLAINNDWSLKIQFVRHITLEVARSEALPSFSSLHLYWFSFRCRRGLNPPHRVKSISMTSFTPEEMEFLKSRGNDVSYTCSYCSWPVENKKRNKVLQPELQEIPSHCQSLGINKIKLTFWAHLCILHGGLLCVAFCPSVCQLFRLDNNSYLRKYYC